MVAEKVICTRCFRNDTIQCPFNGKEPVLTSCSSYVDKRDKNRFEIVREAGKVKINCRYCGDDFDEDIIYSRQLANGDEIYFCEDCEDDFYDEHHTCYWCDEYFHYDTLKENDGHYYCESCLERHFTECDGCGKHHRKDEMTFTEKKHWCNSCHRKNFVECRECNTYYRKDETISYGGKIYCQGCYKRKYQLEHEKAFAELLYYEEASPFSGIVINKTIDALKEGKFIEPCKYPEQEFKCPDSYDGKRHGNCDSCKRRKCYFTIKTEKALYPRYLELLENVFEELYA